MATARFQQTIEIGAALADVHALLADLDQLRVLHPLIETIRELPSTAERPDARRYCVVDRLRLGPLLLRTKYVAELRVVSDTEVEGRAWQSPAIELYTTYRMTASAQGTRLSETTTLRAPRLLRGFVCRQAEMAHRGMLENLRSHFESGPRNPVSGAYPAP